MLEKPKAQSRMDNQEKLTTFGTQDTSREKTKTKHTHTHNTIGVGHYYTQT
jgi:hypothetical protein